MSHSLQLPQERQRRASSRAAGSSRPPSVSSKLLCRLRDVQHRLLGLRDLRGIVQIQAVELRRGMFGRGSVGSALKPGVDVASGFLAMPDGRGDGLVRGDHVAAGEDAGHGRSSWRR